MKISKYISIILIIIITAISFISCSDTDTVNSGESASYSVKSDAKAPESKSGADKAPSDAGSSMVSEAKSKKQADDVYVPLLAANMANIGGKVSYALHIYDEDITHVSSHEKMKSASIIKLFIMEYAFSLIQSGEITTDTAIAGRTLSSLIESMITVSDNNSTNILIDYFGIDKLNGYFAQNGYSDTMLSRRMLDFAAQASGKDNYTSAQDVLKLLDKLYEGKDASPGKDMLEILKKQTVSTKIRKNLPHGTVIANKTGELSDVENDAGIIFSTKGDFALVVLTNDVTSPANTRAIISKSALDLYSVINNDMV